MERDRDFDVFFKGNERRIHYQIQRVGGTGQLYGELYTEGIVALWKAYKSYQPIKGELGTYLNYKIRYQLLDFMRKKYREQEQAEKTAHEETVKIDNGNRCSTTDQPIVDMSGIDLKDDTFWREIRGQLTDNQWKWVKYFIIVDMTVKEIVEIENVSASAVKCWGREVRRKLRDKGWKEKLEELL